MRPIRGFALLNVIFCLGTVMVAAQQVGDLSKLDLATLEQQANAGVPAAEAELGTRYMKGRGVAQDYGQAHIWFEKAADKSNIAGQNALGDIYAKGLGVPKDKPTAISWYQKAASQGNSDGEYSLGIQQWYFSDDEIEHKTALEWFTKAANQGNQQANEELIKIRAAPNEHLREGDDALQSKQYLGALSDYAEADVASIGLGGEARGIAEFKIGMLYYDGLGVDKDYVSAKFYFTRSAGQGNQDAKNMLAQLEAPSSPIVPQVATAQTSPSDDARQEWQDKVDSLTQEVAEAEQEANDAQTLADNFHQEQQQAQAAGGTTGAIQAMISQVGINHFDSDARAARNHANDLRRQLADLNADQPAVNTNVSSYVTDRTNQPDLIQQTANQQEANIRAVGDANAARQQQQAQARIAAEQPAAAQQATNRQAAQLAAQRHAAQQQVAPQAMPPPLPAGTGCTSVNNLVKGTSNWRTGPGAMDHEVVAGFTNNAGFAVSCGLHFHKNGIWDSIHGEGFDLSPGLTLSGESGGLWTIGADSSEVQYMCYQKNATDSQGNSCSARPF